MIATDLDGTLLRNDRTLSRRTLNALRTAVEAGVEVVFVTARPPRFVDALATGLAGTAICSNGAITYDIGSREVVSSRPLAVAAARAVSAALREAVTAVGFGVETGHHVRYEPSYVLRMPEDAAAEMPVAALDDLWTVPFVKLLAYSAHHTADEMVAAAEAVAAGRAQFTHSGGHGLLEVSAAGVGKAGALAALCAERGVAAGDVVAFGDMPNDLSILRWAGIGYAMGNAHEAVLAAADRRTLTNEQDGVAAAIESLLT
ncbi:hydrolase [Lentzea aerocolonigenes]|uniref:Hydrolase n=1 Tax=Lentzea aerocolonigenes TaxID=68170 RepID=A0A0F0GKM9_LENAE|nr:hydrolase [Lentzea aerocolonigenes]